MGLSVGFKIAPGVRVRASSRGMRASIGPRAARVHVGAGRTRISSGAGPVTVSTAIGGGQRRGTARSAGSSGRAARSPGPRQPTVAQLRAQARAAERAQQVADVATAERSLTTLHLAKFPEPSRQVLPVPPRPATDTVESVRRELYQGATAGVPVWKRALRRQAKAWAVQLAPSEAERRYTGAVVATQLEQWHLDQQWQALLTHDPHTVIAAVDEAFADNASDSTCVDAGTDHDTGARYVTAVVSYGGIDLVPEHRPDTTPGGKPTLRKRTKTNRNTLYATAVASTVLATAKEALAVAVAATEARVLVVRPHGAVGVEPVYAGTLRRELLAHRDWRSLDPLDVVMAAENAEMARKGSTREVVTLPVDVDSPARDILNAWSRTYDSEPETEPDESTDG
ncbi:hypothetical protein BA895_10100 [Humibacillus sp. DSM 29435]|uniref:DUF4236 domain-containing protein n=1 Tax=Humibacillus sp. DSM 29435 TaxID=1869167 RepID=UPI0008731DB1|nr:DUF4236 domain-containing protein [Humibacillus sp. DSM 29435]OFE14330.1 hypothetical protein BA895_10100 [Humibacillus sp. DSM 29435]